jgi:hypothetical protein
LGRPQEAEPYLREGLAKSRSVLGEEHSQTIISLNNLGSLLRALGRSAEAEPFHREALEKARRTLGNEHSLSLISVTASLRVAVDQSRPVDELALALPYEPVVRRVFTGSNAPRVADFLTATGRARVALGFDAERFKLAESNLLEAHAIYLAAPDRGPAHRDTRECAQGLVDLYTAWDAAEPGKGLDAKAAEWRARTEASLGAG